MAICEYYEKCPGIKKYNLLLENLKKVGNNIAEKKFRQLLEKHTIQYCSSEMNRENCPHIKKLEKITNY